MTVIAFINALKQYQKLVWSWLAATIVITLIIIFSQPLKYGASSELLIIQNYDSMADPYTVSRSNQYLSNMLSTVVTSQSFFNEVMNSGFQIDKEYFTSDTRKQMKIWEKTVEARSVGDSGLIEIAVYHPDRDQNRQIALAINYTLKTKNNIYHGSGSDLMIKVLNEPIVSVWPVKPNIIVNLLLAIIFGLVTGMTHVYARATGILKPKVPVVAKQIEKPIESAAFHVPAFETVTTSEANIESKTEQAEIKTEVVIPESIFEKKYENGDIRNILS